jgi:hypothetical protein
MSSHLLAAARQVLFEGFGVAGKLRAKFVDLPTKVSGLGVFDLSLLLAVRELLAACFDQRCRCARTLEHRA